MRGRTAKTLSFVLTPVIALSVGAVGFKAFEDFSAEPEIKSPFKTVAAQSSLGMTWLDTFVAKAPFTHPAGGDLNKWSLASANRTLLPSDTTACAAPQPMPPYIMDVKAGSNNTVIMNAAITQPGMNKTIINDYESRADDCNLDFERVSDEEVHIGTDTTLLFYGDSIVSITIDDSVDISTSERKAIINETRQSLIATLEASQCNSVQTSITDNERNIFYTVNNEPKGLFVTEDVYTELDTSNLPTMVDVELDYVNYPNLNKPEGPYPSDFPDPPVKVEIPEVPSLPRISTDNYMKSVTYESPDMLGPGCGWNWTIAQKSPVYDMESLNKNRDEIKTQALREVNESASDYVNTYLSVLTERVSKQDEAVKWNKYTNRINDVHNRWLELENARDSIESSYQEYVNRHNWWATFDDRKNINQEIYDKQVEFCEKRDEEYLKWVELDEERRGYEPAVCGELTRPEILSQGKGEEPSFNLPNGVTIPDSWTKPGKDLEPIISQSRDTANANYDSFVKEFEYEDDRNKKEWEDERRGETETTTTTTTPSTTPSTTPRETPTTTPSREPREPSNPVEDIITRMP